MYCLHCGDCCLRMSPISAPEPCPHIVQDGDFFFCGEYESRPEDCIKHRFPSRVCPIGVENLNLQDSTSVAMRIDEGWDKIKEK